MRKKEIKNSRNPESNRFLLDIQMHNSIGSRTADELTESIATYILEREKVESCTIHFINPKKGNVSFIINNKEIKRLIDFSWDDNQVTKAAINYPDGTDHKLTSDEIARVNDEIYSNPFSFMESAMDIVTLNFVEHLIKTN
jgi:hypothetical protein